jgi:CubicO group peptidase (beta-lactamase class C family)
MIKTIASPLGMNETKITPDEEMKKNLAIGHINGIKTKGWLCPALDGTGSIRSSAYDMLKFLAANMDIAKTPLQLAIHKTHEVRRTMWFTRIGLAWKICNWNKNGIIWHAGRTWGYSSFAGFDKTRGIGVVVLSNSTESVDDIGFYLLNPRGNFRQTKSSKALKSYPYDVKKKKTASKPPLSQNHWSEEDRSLMKKKGYGWPKHPFLARLVRKKKQIKNPASKQFLGFKAKKQVSPSREKKIHRSGAKF